MSLCRQRGVQKALLIVPRPSVAGASLALRRGGVLDHSEHALALSGPPIAAVQDTALRLRPASAEDLPTVSRLLEVGFGQPAPVDLAQLDTARGRILVVELNQTAVGTLRVIRDGGHGRIYGFVIDRQHQGRGLGRGALARACALLRGEGADRIELEVATDNDRALGLYRSVGFTLITTEDYYALR
jgi:ribosomal protein S18 acetylase RimI-like enzyme